MTKTKELLERIDAHLLLLIELRLLASNAEILMLPKTLHHFMETFEDCKTEIERLQTTLQFYAKESTYIPQPLHPGRSISAARIPIEADSGEIARKALTNQPEK